MGRRARPPLRRRGRTGRHHRDTAPLDLTSAGWRPPRGHLASTSRRARTTSEPFPGQAGNVGIAGHRTTYGALFNRIDELQPGDEILLSTSQGKPPTRSRPGTRVDQPGLAATVARSQVEVLEDFGDNRATLTACHPKYSAKQRIIVHAVLRRSRCRPRHPRRRHRPGRTDRGVGGPGLRRGTRFDTRGTARLAGRTAARPPWSLRGGLVARNVKAVGGLARRFPVILVLIWNGYVHMDRYLPAI
ncbi:MAG: class E sortase [Microthrixaceae bacterium]